MPAITFQTMLTTKQIEQKARQDAHDFPDTSVGNAHEIAFFRGATWAIEYDADKIEKIDKLCAEGAALIEKLQAENEALKVGIEKWKEEYEKACNLI